MVGERVVRRLAAILAADVVGYSRLMGRDENGTLARLKAHRTKCLEPVLAHHGGRLVKLTGDGALVEFASAVDAVNAAIEFQQAMAETNRHQSEETAIVFRIGLHLGDLIVDGDDLYGDGVNVAARLEAQAPAGGIVISRTVHEAVMGRLKATFDDLGDLALKNFERPVQAFRVGWDPADWKDSAVAAVALVGSPAPPTAPLALPDKPPIAVLPFQNMSGDPEQEYFADGMVEDIITALCRTKLLFVIARNSSFAYKGKSPDIRQVGRELGVRYVLEGSVRKAGDQLRITGQLIDASNGAHLWADRFAGGLEDIFELQDQVASRVVGAVSPALERAEIERSRHKPTEDLQAYDYYLRALACIYKQKKDANYEGLDLLHKAIGLDPMFALAFAQAATCYQQRKTWHWGGVSAQDVLETEGLVRRALELDRNDPTVLAHAGWVLAIVLGRIEESTSLLDRAVELDPNHFLGWTWGGWTSLFLGREAIKYFERAMRLSPIDPRFFVPQTGIAAANFVIGRYEEASSWAAKALREQPNFPPALRVSMVSHALAGRINEARQACAAYRQFDPAARISSTRNRDPEWMHFQRGDGKEQFEKALRLAGLPE